jgi:purine-binding chemotaxis protein CheW
VRVEKIINSIFHYLIFNIDRQQYALQLGAVVRTVRAVAVTPVPNAPAQILGMVNVQGRIMPVVSLRKMYALPERPLDINDQFVIVHTEQTPVALVVDEVSGVDSCAEYEIIGAETFIPGLDGMRVIAKNDGEIIILHNPNRLPDLEAVMELEAALSKGPATEIRPA